MQLLVSISSVLVLSLEIVIKSDSLSFFLFVKCFNLYLQLQHGCHLSSDIFRVVLFCSSNEIDVTETELRESDYGMPVNARSHNNSL